MAPTRNVSGLYVCGLCKAEYTRADYLIRHVRSHTRQRPFVCSICAKGFGRQDLLKRHVTIHNSNRDRRQSEDTAIGSHNGRNGHRVHQACRPCAEKKLKCADEKPCQRCKEKNLICVSESSGQGLVQNLSTDLSALQSPVPFSRTILETQEEGNSLDFDDDAAAQEEGQHTAPVETSSVLAYSAHNPSTPRQEPVARDILGDTLNFPPMGTDVQYDNDSFLEDLDFCFLYDVGSPGITSPLPTALPLDPSPQQSTMSVGAEAYKHSTAMTAWNPGREDNHDQEQQDLILGQNFRPPAYSAEFSHGRTIPKKELSHTARDRILAMMLRITSGTASSRIIASFPSLDILRDLIHHALIHIMERQIGNFIHVPSFDMNKQRPELLGAIIAYGSITSPSPAVRKFGYALQETIRIAINQLVEEDHAALRELGIAQAFYLQSYLGYYSGVNRKIEMAEANSMLGVTMLRRGMRLRTDQYCLPEALTSLPNISTEQKWLMWAEQESFTRLVYFAVSLDFHVGPARKINALFSCHEIGTPLPSSAGLWNAAKAADWLQALTQDSALRTQQPLALCRVMRQPQRLAACKELVDYKVAATAYLAGCWSLVAEYWHTDGLLPSSQTTLDFVLRARHSELLSMLEDFKAQCTDRGDYGPEVQILQELVFLHLHVSFDDVAHYCGSGSEADAQASAPYVQQWYQSPRSRDAAWHAGQIFGAAKLLPIGALSDIYIIALYHAGVVLWVWGLLYKVQPVIPESSASSAVVDGEETPEISRFLRTGRCRPCLTDKSGVIFSLDDSAMVPELAKDIIEMHSNQESLPWTTREVYGFMTEFAKVTRQKFDRCPAGDLLQR